MRFCFRNLFVFASVSALAFLHPSSTRAQNPPPGAIFDLSSSSYLSSTGVLDSDTLISTNFVGDGNTEYISFAFRDVPSFFSFDDALMNAAGSSRNLLVNPGFEQGATVGPADVGLNDPDDWSRWVQFTGANAIGQVASNTASYGCGDELAHSGTQFWCDGSVEGYDGIYQAVATSLGTTYEVSFYLADNSGLPITNPGIDMLVYAGDTIPAGSISIAPPPTAETPEPASFALLGSGLLFLGFASGRFRMRQT